MKEMETKKSMSLNKSDKPTNQTMHLPTILVEVLPADKMRYKTLGDWYFQESTNVEPDLYIKVLKQEGKDACKKEACLVLHEFVEALLCRFKGITQKQVDDFDMGTSEEQVHKDGYPEHGFHPAAPYKDQHSFAFILEQLFSRELQLNLGDLVYGDFYNES